MEHSSRAKTRANDMNIMGKLFFGSAMNEQAFSSLHPNLSIPNRKLNYCTQF